MGVQKENNLGYSPNEQEKLKKKIVTQMQMFMLFSISCI